MQNVVAVVAAGRNAGPTVLGQRNIHIPTAGKIRAGIKVLTRKAQENPAALSIYEEGLRAGRSFDDIERSIVTQIPDLARPLVPKNVPYFTVRPGDFPNPETAAQIMRLYAEDRGDGVPRLYRFPVIFPADVWQAVMPHGLVAWGAGEKKFWSEYAPDGRTRVCKCYAPVPPDRSGRKPARTFGGRKTQLRRENNGMCDPENCREFQERKCNLSGRFIFYIPGVQSCDAFELPTNSVYSMTRAIQKFEALAFLRGGRISGFLDAKRTTFYISKVERDVPHIDEQGRSVRTKIWLIELEAPIDVTALLNVSDGTVLSDTTRETLTLDGTQPGPGVSASPPCDQVGAPADDRDPDDKPKRQSGADACDPAEPILAVVDAFGLERGRFEVFAKKKWGTGWKFNAGGRARVLATLESFEDLAALKAEVDSVLG
ncbi:hypothetical protein [Massilia sp. YMA4]|uniref:Uncharacterized protein n=1 Tax=[Empedobacter] haloabium TaxID=592317 RepID=A0ABZ1URN8_9BURK|nr:hypothetical protein [Massilia sp. YMA4]